MVVGAAGAVNVPVVVVVVVVVVLGGHAPGRLHCGLLLFHPGGREGGGCPAGGALLGRSRFACGAFSARPEDFAGARPLGAEKLRRRASTPRHATPWNMRGRPRLGGTRGVFCGRGSDCRSLTARRTCVGGHCLRQPRATPTSSWRSHAPAGIVSRAPGFGAGRVAQRERERGEARVERARASLRWRTRASPRRTSRG